MPASASLGLPRRHPAEQRAAARREALMAMASGMVAEPLAGLSSLWGAAIGRPDLAVQNIEAVRNALTYPPRDPSSL